MTDIKNVANSVVEDVLNGVSDKMSKGGGCEKWSQRSLLCVLFTPSRWSAVGTAAMRCVIGSREFSQNPKTHNASCEKSKMSLSIYVMITIACLVNVCPVAVIARLIEKPIVVITLSKVLPLFVCTGGGSSLFCCLGEFGQGRLSTLSFHLGRQWLFVN